MLRLRGCSVKHSEQLALLATLMCLALTSCTRVAAKTEAAADAVPVRAVQATLQDVPLELSAVGNVEAVNSVEVKSRIAGQIDRVAFEEGQNLTKGQLLFRIDPETLERQAAEQHAELERDDAMEQQARAVVARDAAAQKQSQSEADVAVKLGDLGVISGQRVNELVTTSDTSHAALRSDQAAVDAAEGATKADRARLAQTQLQLHFTDVAAPITGRAGAALVKTGNMVRDNDTTLVTILQLAPIYVTFGIPEQHLPEVQRLNAAGHLAVEAENAGGAPLAGQLAFIDNTVNTTTGTIRLKAVFANAENALWPGEFVQVRLRLGIESGRTIVPESSVQNGLDGKYVWLAKSGIATVAPVTVLRTYQPPDGPEEAIISGGVHAGDLIVTEGQLRLTAGVRISLLDAPRTQPSRASGANAVPQQ
jgi:multidrug efflux system membrane fusion protein